MHLARNRGEAPQIEPNLTAFVDVIFQLVLFFVFSLHFLAPERYLGPFLPRGGEGPGPGLERTIQLFLSWSREGGDPAGPSAVGLVTCSCPLYHPPDGSPAVEGFTFPRDPRTRVVLGPGGSEMTTTETFLVDPDDGRRYPVTYEYGVPDFAEIEAYVRSRVESMRRLGLGSPSVIIDFEPEVPWQMPVNIFDICARLGIDEVTLGSGLAD
jgi:hypothetical protein